MDFKGDRTVIIPTPGGRPATADVAPAQTFSDSGNWSTLFDDADKFISSGFNRLENAAFKLLSLIPTIKSLIPTQVRGCCVSKWSRKSSNTKPLRASRALILGRL